MLKLNTEFLRSVLASLKGTLCCYAFGVLIRFNEDLREEQFQYGQDSLLWTNNLKFMPMVKDAWSIQIRGFTLFPLIQKKRRLWHNWSVRVRIIFLTLHWECRKKELSCKIYGVKIDWEAWMRTSKEQTDVICWNTCT